MDMNLISYETVVKDLEAHPAKRIFWRSGWAWKGAGEGEVATPRTTRGASSADRSSHRGRMTSSTSSTGPA